MAIEWSGLSPELLAPASSRELARELGVSRGMVQECYRQLLPEGYLTSRTGPPPGSPAAAASTPAAGPAVVSPRAPSLGRHPRNRR